MTRTTPDERAYGVPPIPHQRGRHTIDADRWTAAERASEALHGGRLLVAGMARYLTSEYESERRYTRLILFGSDAELTAENARRFGERPKAGSMEPKQPPELDAAELRRRWWEFHVIPARSTPQTANESLASYARHAAEVGGEARRYYQPPTLPESAVGWPIYRAAIIAQAYGR